MSECRTCGAQYVAKDRNGKVRKLTQALHVEHIHASIESITRRSNALKEDGKPGERVPEDLIRHLENVSNNRPW